MTRTARSIVLFIAALAMIGLAGCAAKPITSLAEIEQDANRTLDRLGRINPGARELVGRAHGVLIFPRVYKAGIGVGGEFGDGVLREGGRTTGYYRIVSGSFGFQLGVQKHGQVIAFMDRRALDRFKRSAGWQAGVDGSIVVADLGASGQATSLQLNQPILGFIVGEAGLMYNVSFEGSKITRIEP
jgi:lipid-binding SYLF domain-containing protein